MKSKYESTGRAPNTLQEAFGLYTSNKIDEEIDGDLFDGPYRLRLVIGAIFVVAAVGGVAVGGVAGVVWLFQ